VAFIYKSAGTTISSPLAKADYPRQKDMFKLANMGNRQSIRLWNDFAAEDPATARLIVAECAIEKSEKIEANKHMDKVLTKGESKPKVTKSEKRAVKQIRNTNPDLAKSEKQFFTAILANKGTSPLDQETARKWLAKNG
jgi:hypothetical protein